jgi:hypothetical protein
MLEDFYHTGKNPTASAGDWTRELGIYMLLSYNAQKLLIGLYLNNAEAGSATFESRSQNSAEILQSLFPSIIILVLY